MFLPTICQISGGKGLLKGTDKKHVRLNCLTDLTIFGAFCLLWGFPFPWVALKPSSTSVVPGKVFQEKQQSRPDFLNKKKERNSCLPMLQVFVFASKETNGPNHASSKEIVFPPPLQDGLESQLSFQFNAAFQRKMTFSSWRQNKMSSFLCHQFVLRLPKSFNLSFERSADP